MDRYSKTVRVIILILLIGLSLAACKSGFQSVPTEIPSATHTASPTLMPTDTTTPTSTPTVTTTPTETPTITPSPTITLTPTPTSVLVSEPIEVDTSGFDHSGRPQLSGVVRSVDTEHFRIFYSMSGEDAVLVKDKNGNAVPDHVEDVAEALEHTWKVQIDDLGWSPPPDDMFLGGDDRFDVYLEDLDLSLIGYVDFSGLIIGDNPDTIVKELNATSSYMGLDNDFLEATEDNFSLSASEWMQTTVTHEFNHAIQSGYDSLEPFGWLWEATATWMETVVHPDIKDSNFFLTASFKSQDTCLLAYGGYDRVEDRGHWYSLWLFLQFMAEEYGNEIVPKIWEKARSLDGYEAIDAALKLKQTNLEEVYRNYAVALLLRDFDFDLSYPEVRLEGILDREQTFTPQDGVWQTGADFIEIDMEGIVKISIRGLDHGTVVGVSNLKADLYPLADKTVTIDTGKYHHVYLIVYNLDRAETPQDCRETQYSVQVLYAEEPVSPSSTIPAPHFKVPTVDPLLDPALYP